MTGDKRITVFTPTYNRGYIINSLYESLIRQTNQSFIWLIIDDGSTDNTEELVKNWISKEKIEIQYHKQKNGGKQRAHNKGVELCETEFFICVDSDDFLTENTIERLISTWDNIENIEGLSGIVALRGRDKDTPIGTRMPKDVQTSTLTDLYSKYGFRGDTALLFKTEILKEYPFFVAEDEKFIGEGYVYLQIDQHYSLYLLDEILYIGEYLEDGYTTNVRKLIRNNPKGYTILKKQAVVYSKSFKDKFKNTISYLIGCILSNEKNAIKNAPYKWIAVVAYPFAFLLYIKWYS